MPWVHTQINWNDEDEAERFARELAEAERREKLRKAYQLTATSRQPKQAEVTAHA